MAARPRTLPAAAAPVFVGTAYAATLGTFQPLVFIATLLGALLIQIGTNLSNDYSDARRGADTEDRLGPVRVTAGGLVPPKQVLIATYVAFGLAVLVGVYLVAVAGWQLLLVGIFSILAGVLYTGGPRPYGYEGLGEVFVFLFFGIVAVTGTFFAAGRGAAVEAFVLAVPVGLLATAILMVNNIRDQETDRRAGKRTLAVRLGRDRSRVGYAITVYLAFATAPLAWALGGEHLTPWLLLPWLALPLAAPIVRVVRNKVDGPALNGALARTGMLQLAFCVLCRRGCCCPSDRAERPHRAVHAPRPLRASWGELREREVLVVRLDFPTGSGARARPRRSSPTTACRWRRCGPRWTPTRTCCEAVEPTADVLEACRAVADLPQALAGIDLALWDHASRRTGTPLARLIDPRAMGARAGQRDGRRLRPRGGGRRGRHRRARRVPLREGQGRDRGRRGAPGRRARRRRAEGRHPRGRERGLGYGRGGAGAAPRARAAPAWSCARSRCTASTCCARCRRGRGSRSRWTRRTRPARAVSRAVCLKITARRDHRRARRCAAPPGRRGADVYLASTFDGPRGSPPPFTPRRRCG